MLTNKKDSPHSLIYTYLVFNYIKLGNCDVRILWLDPLLQQLVGLRNRILVNKDLFLYLIYPFLCFVSIFFFRLQLSILKLLEHQPEVLIQLLQFNFYACFLLTLLIQKKKLFFSYIIYLHIFLSIKSRSVIQVNVCVSKVKNSIHISL